jgi:hypothetical protein
MYHLKDQSKMSSKVAEETSSSSDGDLQIVCEIIGNPINSINWFKDGVRVRDESTAFTEKYAALRNNTKLNSRAAAEQGKKRKKVVSIHTTQLSTHKFISKLKVRNLENADNGVYKCSVNGLDGDTAKTISINGYLLFT